jgi:hypothetical protein
MKQRWTWKEKSTMCMLHARSSPYILLASFLPFSCFHSSSLLGRRPPSFAATVAAAAAAALRPWSQSNERGMKEEEGAEKSPAILDRPDESSRRRRALARWSESSFLGRAPHLPMGVLDCCCEAKKKRTS